MISFVGGSEFWSVEYRSGVKNVNLCSHPLGCRSKYNTNVIHRWLKYSMSHSDTCSTIVYLYARWNLKANENVTNKLQVLKQRTISYVTIQCICIQSCVKITYLSWTTIAAICHTRKIITLAHIKLILHLVERSRWRRGASSTQDLIQSFASIPQSIVMAKKALS